jgi:hypothetical protein
MLEMYHFSSESKHSNVATLNYSVAYDCLFPVIANGLEKMMPNL